MRHILFRPSPIFIVVVSDFVLRKAHDHGAVKVHLVAAVLLKGPAESSIVELQNSCASCGRRFRKFMRACSIGLRHSPCRNNSMPLASNGFGRCEADSGDSSSLTDQTTSPSNTSEQRLNKLEEDQGLLTKG